VPTLAATVVIHLRLLLCEEAWHGENVLDGHAKVLILPHCRCSFCNVGTPCLSWLIRLYI
jgi:hypothetical protein